MCVCVLQVDDAAARRGDIAATCYLNASLTVSSSIMIHRYAHVDRNRVSRTGNRAKGYQEELGEGQILYLAGNRMRRQCVAVKSKWTPSGNSG